MRKTLGEMTRFGSVGGLVTLLGYALIFVFYNLLGLGYWGSSAAAYLLASLVSYKLNKKLTFQAQGHWKYLLPKFALNIGICYLVAYSLARPVIITLLESRQNTPALQENIALATGIVIFTALNYLGQKFFVFKGKTSVNSRC